MTPDAQRFASSCNLSIECFASCVKRIAISHQRRQLSLWLIRRCGRLDIHVHREARLEHPPP
jgi:hypothetical protein